MNLVVFVLLILGAFTSCFNICFDLLFIKLHKNGNQEMKKSLCFFLFIAIYATTIIYLSSGNFNKVLFCSMNIQEEICSNQENYKHSAAFVKTALYVSAPRKILPDMSNHLGYSDIININGTISPCTLQLRSSFFIETFQMSAFVSPNNFVLLNGKPLEFASQIDFNSWSKQGSAILN